MPVDADLVLCILAVLVAVAGGCLELRLVRRRNSPLQASFGALQFPTPAGHVPASAVDVLRRVQLNAGQSGRIDLTSCGDCHYWYLRTPGPGYLLAVASVTGKDRTRVDWQLRPLDEARMRGALADDAAAFAKAFGTSAASS